MMSTFNANDFGPTIRLEYRCAPVAVEPYVDPVAQRLGVVGTIFAAGAWVSFLASGFVGPENILLPLSVALGVIGTCCAIGAMLDRHIPRFAWVAAANLLLYWVVMVGVAFRVLINIISTP